MSNDSDAVDDLYPELSEQAKAEAVRLIESFKKDLAKAAEEVLVNLYTDIMPYIESDSWSNFRGKILSGIKGYNHISNHLGYDFKAIRAQIFKEHRDEIINDINQDLLDENEKLKEDIERERERCREIINRNW